MALLGSIQKDLKWRLADPLSLVMWIGIPLLIGGLMGLVFSGGGLKAKLKLLVVDQDDTILTNVISGASGGGLLAIEKVSLVEGRRRIGEGDGSGLLVIPKGFTQNLLDDAPTPLELTTNPSQQIFPKMLQEGLEMLVDVEFFLQRVAGDIIKDLSKFQPSGQSTIASSAVVGVFAIKVNNRLKSLEPIVIPPTLSVEDELTTEQGAEQPPSTGPPGGFGLLLFPGILFMSLMFMAQGISYDIWREKDQGTLARLLCSPTGPATFLVAKALSGGLAMMAVAAVGLILGYVAFDLPASAIPGALVWSSASGVSLLVLFFVIQMLSSSSTGGNVLSSVVLFPLMMIGGSFFPFEAMPKGLASIGQTTPNGLAVSELKNIMAGEMEWGSLAISTLLLGAMTLVFFAIAVRQLNTRFRTA